MATWECKTMIRSGVGLAASVLAISMMAATMGDAFADPPGKKAAPAAAPARAAPAPAARAAPPPRPAPAAIARPAPWHAPHRPWPVPPRRTWRPGSPHRHARRRGSQLPPRVRPPPSNAPRRRRGPQAVSSGVSRMCNPGRPRRAAHPAPFRSAANRPKPASAAIAIAEPAQPLRTARVAATLPAQTAAPAERAAEQCSRSR